MAHAKLSPSGAERWMNCPGSVVLEESCADSTSEYADEGTAAHALSALCLVDGQDARAYQGRRLAVINGVYWPGLPAPVPPLLKGHTTEIVRHFDVDEEMVEHVQTYIDNVRQYASGDNALLVEVALPIGHLTGEEGAQGTGDAVIFADGGAELQLHDLKFGRGKVVSPIGNKQLMTYGLGALAVSELLGHDVQRVRLVIHQPRVISAPQEWALGIEELHAFAKEIERAAARVDAALVYAEHYPTLHDKYLNPGEEQCRWCKAKATCPKACEKVEQEVGEAFTVVAPPVPDAVEAVLAQWPEDLLGAKLDAVDFIETWCKAVRAEAERRLVAGIPVPSPTGGYKLVQGRKGPRQWIDALAAEARLKAMRLKVEDMYDLKVISPTSAEKLLAKDSPKRWSSLQEHIQQSQGKLHVAPMADVRDAVVQASVEDAFTAAPQVSREDLG